MGRRLFNTLSALSLGMCVLLLLLFIQSVRQTMTVTEFNGGWQFNYHDTGVSHIYWHTFHLFGWRVPLHVQLLLSLVLPVCWVGRKIKTLLRAPSVPGKA
jgi:hypothetical protein